MNGIPQAKRKLGCVGIHIALWAAIGGVVAQPSMVRAEEAVNRSAEVTVPKNGTLVIIGGCERFDNEVIWSTIVDLAGGKGARIAVFPTASGTPVQYGNEIVHVLNEAGAEAFVVPVALTGFDRQHKDAVSDPDLVKSVREATGVFFVGGDQSRIRKVLVTEKGENSPMLNAIWDVYRNGGVIAGTSAGAAIMSRIMFRHGRTVLSNLVHGLTMGKEIDKGLGFMAPDWFVDQHVLIRGRVARSLVAMHSQGFKYGLGVDEDTAVVVRDGVARVIGYKGAIVMDLSEATSDGESDHFNLKNAQLTYLDRGDSMDMRTLDVKPSDEKCWDRKVNPRAPDFRPAFRSRVFCNDILGNTAVLDVMTQVLDNKYPEAFGLAFDGAAARHGSTPGFEFRFYRGEDTVGWETEAFGGDDYTIVNIHLDVTPIEVTGPLYTKQ